MSWTWSSRTKMRDMMYATRKTAEVSFRSASRSRSRSLTQWQGIDTGLLCRTHHRPKDVREHSEPSCGSGSSCIWGNLLEEIHGLT